MNKKDYEQLASNLDKIEEYSMVTERLLERIEEINETIIDKIDENDYNDNYKRFDYGGFGIRTYISNIGTFTTVVHFFADDNYSYEAIPATRSEINSYENLHGHYGTQISYTNRSVVLEYCNTVHDFIKNTIEVIEKLNAKEEVALETLEDIDI